jgi:uncharacterized protein
MKYLLMLLLALLVFWAWKRSRLEKPKPPDTPTPASEPLEMVTCAHCGIHLPHEEAVTGQKGVYCSTEHRTSAQDRNPA